MSAGLSRTGSFGILVIALSACQGGARMGGSFVPEQPSMSTRCRVGASQTSVLVTEWPAAEKSNLEALLPGGAVAVEFSGCEMRILPECRLPGGYRWMRTTPGTDIIEIQSEADLYTKLPLGAVSLSGELQRSGSLYVETTVAGQLRLEGMSETAVPSTAECAYATHLVGALSLGAFTMSAGGQGRARGTLGAHGVEAGGGMSGSSRVVRHAGRADACGGASYEAPPLDCAAPIQAFLLPIPGRAELPGPPGTVKVDFVSGSGSVRWDVYVDDQATCTTPCATWIDPSRPVLLRTREDAPDKLHVRDLDAAAGPLQVAAIPTSRGKLATGITFTSLGGLALITGITLSAVGCPAGDRAIMCNAGIISGAAGAAVTAGAIWLILDSLPSVQVRPIFTAERGRALGIGPGYVAGTF